MRDREGERDTIGGGSIQLEGVDTVEALLHTHRSANSTTRNGQFNALAPFETVESDAGPMAAETLAETAAKSREEQVREAATSRTERSKRMKGAGG